MASQDTLYSYFGRIPKLYGPVQINIGENPQIENTNDGEIYVYNIERFFNVNIY